MIIRHYLFSLNAMVGKGSVNFMFGLIVTIMLKQVKNGVSYITMAF